MSGTNAAPAESDGPLVLVVDDDPINRKVMSAALKRLGYRFHLATNGREAVDAICQQSYAAVLMDCLMPVMDGYGATAAIRQIEREQQTAGRCPRVPIIAVTAVAIQGARQRCLAAGMDDYLSKPIVVEAVADVLDRWVVKHASAATWTPELFAEPPLDDVEVIDPRALDALRQLDPEGADAFLADVRRDFTTEVAPRFAILRTAVTTGDTLTLLRELHYVAGCAAIVGATRVERLARALEIDGLTDSTAILASAALLVDRLEDEFTRARTTLEALTV